MLRSIMLSSLPALLLLVTETQGAPTDECCREKRVGDTFYTLLIDDSFTGGVPDRCLNDCIYSVTGTSEPKFCFARGELPVECEDNGYGSGYGYGYGYGYGQEGKKQQPNHISPTSQVIQLSFAIILLLWTSAIMTAFNCSLSQLRSL